MQLQLYGKKYGFSISQLILGPPLTALAALLPMK